jgi:DNA repair exonuclease SbcCD ATPase subunit/DNA repair exonuclease SbcCD nuclease subunit
MKIEKIDIGIDSIRKIYHIGDVHIRNLKRRQEYKTVFERLAESIKKTLTPNDIIYLAGDIVHAKTDMSPELVQAVQEFFKMFADLAPTILITGNHDCNLNNKSRLDALTPIVNAINHPNLLYLKESGIYEIADKHFVVMSVFDKPKDFIKADSFDAKYKIALHHGAVNSATTDIGFVLVNDHVDLETFKGYDLTLLGDIHKPAQYLNKEKTIAYVGSTIQQNHSEALEHGMLVWDTDSKKSDFVVIPNDFCYYTVEIENGVYNELPKSLNDKRVRLRVKIKNTSTADFKKIVAEIKEAYHIEEYTVQKVKDASNVKNASSKNCIKDVRDVEYQNELIIKHLEERFALEDYILDGIRHVNRTINSNLPKLESRRNISWTPKRFEFSNMFSYGENNVIDFSNMNGSYGLFAPNASGKSTLLDAITFCIYDKCSRTSKALSVLNNKSNSFECIFNFQLDNKDYFIKKRAVRGRGGHVRVDVDFYCIEDGVVESLNGKERSDTNNNIRNVLGTYEDFILTALSIQNNNSGFIDMAQKDRKDLLAQFLDINIFEELYSLATQEIKEVSTLLKEYRQQNFETGLAEASNNIQALSIKQSSLESEKGQLDSVLEKLNNEIINLNRNLIPIDSAAEDISNLKSLKIKIEEIIKHLNESIESKKMLIEESNLTISKTNTLIEQIDLQKIQDTIKLIESKKSEETSLKISIEKIKSDLRHKMEKMEKLNDLKYDENCSYCMNNVFVKDAIKTKNSIEIEKQTALESIEKLKLLTAEVSQLSTIFQEKDSYDELCYQRQRAQSDASTLLSESSEMTSKLHQASNKLTEVNYKIEEYYKKEAAITKNKEIKAEIQVLEDKLSEVKKLIDVLNQQILECRSNIIVNEQLKIKSEESIKKLQEYERQYKFYEYYLLAVSRDGVPYDLIATAVPTIEQEINNILSELVTFQLALEMDGKNINCYIMYDNDSFWPIELTSGMEKFISSLAIRTSLINISSLPKPNFLVIDEGLGNLDSDVLNEFASFLNYLETQFTFVIMISHIEAARDMVKSLIEITKVNGFSKIDYV